MQAKNQIKHKSPSHKPRFYHLKHPFMIPVVLFFVFFFLGIAYFINQNGQTIGANDSRIVELSVDGKTQVFPTTAQTVGDLLSRLNITIFKGDVVEPALTTPILQNNFQINIYRVHPVTVVENNQKTVISTADNNPRTIAADAGYKIYPEDYVNSVNNADNMKQGILGQEVEIVPAIPVILDLYGTQVTERTHTKTIAELLSTNKIQTNSGNNVLPALSTPITPNLQILVVPVGQHLISAQQVIPFAVQNINDPTIPYGQTQIVQAGSNGLELVVKDINNNGAAINNQLQQVIITQPTPEIINHGTGIVPIAGGNNITWLKSSNININDYSNVNIIINRESHWNPDDINGIGCIGLGQSCGYPPGLAVVCPDWQINAVCQLNFFNSYAVGRYGSWAGAVAHENNYGWW